MLTDATRPKRTTAWLQTHTLALLVAAWGLGSVAWSTAGAEDAMTRTIRLIMEEKLAASDAESYRAFSTP